MMSDDTKGKFKAIVLGTTLVCLIGFATYFSIRRFETYRQEYSAYVIDKQVRRIETDEGGLVRYVLLAEDLYGNSFYIQVSANIYQQVQPGTFIEKRATDKEPTIGR